MPSPKPSLAPQPTTSPFLTDRAKIIYAVTITTALLWLWYLYTGQMWEDFLITLRHSQNAALGNGLVYTNGERVHGFTSPLNVLLPTAILVFNASLSPEAVLTIYNSVATALVIGASIPLYRFLLGNQKRHQAAAWLFFPLMVSLNLKICSFAMNGQEAAFTIAFLGLALVALWRDTSSAWRLAGVSWGGLMWTRPDSPLLIASLSIAGFVFTSRPRKEVLLSLGKSAALCAAIYLPWFLWAWSYYGSPIPHTILAKRLYTNLENGSAWYWISKLASSFWRTASFALTPPYAEAGGWPAWYHQTCRILVLGASLYWLLPVRDRVGRSASFVCLCWLVYQGYVEATARAFPWYFPAASFTAIIVFSRALQVIASRGQKWTAASWLVASLLVALSAYGYLASLRPIKWRQDYVENGVRRQVGLWLKEHVPPGEHVYLEPIGYIGYFSGCDLYDYPGLVSPRVVRALGEFKASFASCILILKPEWLVLRADEANVIGARTSVLSNYKLLQVFRMPEEAFPLGKTDSTYALQSDTIFGVFQRVGP